MLEPEGRHLLLDALRPPTGYVLDRAVGTTFTLDLAALLTAPVGFALLDRESRDGRVTTDPVALLESVRRNADRIDVFCQAGLIGLPPNYQPIVSYLETSIHEALAPRDGHIFHPKVWLIRYQRTDEVARDEPDTRYRLLCLSRNLTFDRAWDTILRLEGEPQADPVPSSEPLARFIRSLVTMSRDPLSEKLVDDLDELADQASRVRFTPPPGFDGLAFVPLGIDKRKPDWPFDGQRVDRMLVVSPFVTRECLERLDRPRSEGRDVLISRAETFNELGATAIRRFGDIFTLSGDATSPDEDLDDSDEEAIGGAASDEATAERPDAELRGLHAKLFVVDQGWRARVWTGSANATHGAFEGNVEFLVELEGRKTRCGVDAVIGDQGDGLTLRSLLEPYSPVTADFEPPTIEEQLENRLEYARRDLATLRFNAHVTAGNDGGHELRLTGEASPGRQTRKDWSGISIRCRPLTYKAAYAQAIDISGSDIVADFGSVSFEALTSFFAFELEAHEVDASARLAFLVNARLVGAPVDRRERMLANLLRNRSDLMRFLLFLLGGEPADQQTMELGPSIWSGSADEGNGAPVEWQNLFEPMVRALAHDPRQLDDIDGLVRDLRRTDEGGALLPDDWDVIWEPIWAVRKDLAQP